jgi:transposase InsO family protein
MDRLKAALTCDPVVVPPNWNKPFILQTDSSEYGVGAVLCQISDDGSREQVIAYASHSLNKAQRNYTVSDKEAYALIWGIRHFRPYLIGRHFELFTDHAALQFLNTMRLDRDLSGRLARYQMFLQEYQFTARFRKGISNANADALSRHPSLGGPDSSSIQVVNVDLMSPTNDVHLDLGPGDPSKTEPQTQLDKVEYLKQLPSIEEFIALQHKDPQLKPLIDALKAQPKTGNDVEHSKESKASRLQLSDQGLLQARRRIHLETHVCPVVPLCLRPLILYHVHADPQNLAAHLGLHKTYAAMVTRYYWKGMFKDVQNFVYSCHKCASRKHPKHPAVLPAQGYVPQGGPFSEISFDALGPLPTSRSGNKHILVFMCRLTKYCELFAVPDTKEERVADIIANKITPRYGCPKTILSDGASAFNSERMQQIYALLNSKKITTSPYNPQLNGQVERFNETLVVMLTMFVNKFQTDWDEYLKHVEAAYHSAPNTTTGFSPNYMLYGRELRRPMDTILESRDLYRDRSDYLSRLLQRMDYSQELAKAHLLQRSIDMEEESEAKATRIDYKFGEKVYLYVPDSRTGLTNKLRSRWHGPYSVLDRTSVVNYRLIRTSPNGMTETRLANVRRMKPYVEPNSISAAGHELGDQNNASRAPLPNEFKSSAGPSADGSDSDADQDEEYEVEAILDKKLIRRKMHYLVKWVGWDSKFNTWEPREHLVNSSVLVEEYEHKSRQ